MGIRQIAAIGIGGTAVAGGVGGLYYVSQDKTIKDRLTSQGVKLIDTKSEQKVWQLAWEEIKDEATLKDVEKTVTEENTLKTWCTATYDKPLTDKDNLEKAKKICVQPSATIGERLTRAGKSLVNDWGSKLKTLKEQKALLQKLKIIADGSNSVEANKENEGKLKKWCEDNQNTKLTLGGGEYGEFIKVCI